MFYITADSSLWGWGPNKYGEVGDGTALPIKTPVKIMNNVKSVSTSGDGLESFSLAVKNDGTLWVWGCNEVGQLGDGTSTISRVPLKVMDQVAVASAGSNHFAAVKTDGSLWVAGANIADNGMSMSEPIKIMDGVKEASAGFYCTMALKNDGCLWGFGSTDNAVIGVAGPSFVQTPVKVMDDVELISAGDHTMAVKKDGSLWAWGSNNAGQIGTGATAGYADSIPMPVKVADNVLSASGRGWYSLAIKQDGGLYGWGDTGFQFMAYDNPARLDSLALTPQLVLSDVTMESSSYYRALAVTKDGRLWTWGVNSDGTTDTTPTPVTMPEEDMQPIWGDPPVTLPEGKWNDGTAVTKVSASSAVMVLKVDGSVWAWGQNDGGQVGDGTAKDRTAPVEILENAMDVQTSGRISKALIRDGTVQVWGAAAGENNESLGDGAYVGSRIPITLTDNATSISINSLILKNDHSLWGWNRYTWGSPDPYALKLHLIESGVTGTFIDSCDIRQTDGSLLDVVWGSDDGGNQYKFSFEALDSNIIDQARGEGFLLQVHKDGTLWARQADYTMGGILHPSGISDPGVKILDNVKKVVCGSYHALALLNDGSLWAWGLNSEGQIGDGEEASLEMGRHYWSPMEVTNGTPVKIMGNVTDIAAGPESSYAIMDDGSLWAWGSNSNGQLGNGTTNTNATTPIQINSGVSAAQTESLTIKLTAGDLAYMVNDKEAFFDAAPYIDGTTGRTMVPIRFITDALGAKATWDDASKADSISLNGKTLKIILSQPLPNGMGQAVLVNDRLFVPIRYVSEELGATIQWDAVTNQVTIGL